MDFREIITLAPTVVFAIAIGVMPALILNMFTPWVSNLMKSFGG
jgi:NADH:ubiquinone oxidoreductase subunit 4 (subunit M)